MSHVPNLLNDDGSASMATLIMMSHHGFRRDLARFRTALERVSAGDLSRVDALGEEWKTFRATLHGHHEAEDNGLFPSLASQHDSVRATIERLSEDHRRIDPLLERGAVAFSDLSNPTGAASVIRDLEQLLGPHLATEEAELSPLLREAKVFPPLPNAEAAIMYAQGFAWAMHGIASDVLDKVHAMLPESLTSRLPAARAAFEARCERVWGSSRGGSARTPIPDTGWTSS
jgi:hypothetical protein